MPTLAKFVGTDNGGNPVEAYFDLEKEVSIIEIPEEFEWALKTEDENQDGETVEYIGGRPKRD